MSIHLSTKANTNFSTDALSDTSAKNLRKQIESILPGSSVSVAKVDGVATFGFFSLGAEAGITPSQMIEYLKKLAPNGVTLSFNYKKASENELRSLFLTPALESHSVKFKGFENLTPAFMKDLATARPHLELLDLRGTTDTHQLAEAYLTEQKAAIDKQSSHSREMLRELSKKRLGVMELQVVAKDDQKARQDSIQQTQEEIAKIGDLESQAAKIEKPSPAILKYIENFKANKLELENKLAQLKTEEKQIAQQLEAYAEQVEALNSEMTKCRSFFFDLENKTIVVKISHGAMSSQERRNLEQKYPDVAFIDGSTHLDLSGTSLSIDKIRKKVSAQRHLMSETCHIKTLDLSNIPGLDLFALYRLEKELALTITCNVPEIFEVPKMTEIEGETRNTTVQEIEMLLRRFAVDTVGLRCVKELTVMDVLYLEDTFPQVKFVAPVDQNYTFPVFDKPLIDKLCTRYPDLTLQLSNVTAEDEQIVTVFVAAHPNVDFRNSERLSLLLQDSKILKFYLERALDDNQKSALSSSDLESLAIQCPSIASTMERVCQFRNKQGNLSKVDLLMEIRELKIDPLEVQVAPNNVSQKISYSLEKLINKYGTEKSQRIIKADLPEAENSTGEKLLDGVGVAKNIQEAVQHFKVAADKGYAAAQHNLASLYLKGEGVPKSEKEAVKLFTLAANQGYAAAQYQLGQMYEKGVGVLQDEARAARLYTQAANQGVASAQYSLACMYDEGRGVTQNDKEAVKLFELAAKQGHSDAQYQAGLMYLQGVGIKQDHKEAIRLLTLAANQGHTKAQFQLGVVYETGKGVAQNFQEAKRFYTLAAAGKSTHAQYNLARMYLWGTGVEKNETQAAQLFEQAALLGHVAAQCQIGRMYELGQGVTKDNKRAIQFYEMAVNQGSTGALVSLGCMYEWGKEVPKDLHKAEKYYKHAVEQKDPVAETKLGHLYESGMGGQPNYQKAAELYRLAVNQGNALAQNYLGCLYEKGNGVGRDIKEAARLYLLAAEQDLPEAQNNYGRLCLEAKGTVGSRAYQFKLGYQFEAERYFKLAADQGLIEAQWRLAFLYKLGEPDGVPRNYVEAAKYFKLAADAGDATGQAALGYLYEVGMGVKRDSKEALRLYRLAVAQGNMWAQNDLARFYACGIEVEKNMAEAFKLYTLAANQGHKEAKLRLSQHFESKK